VLVYGDTSTVVGDADRVVRVDDDFCMSAVAGERLIDGVVDYLVDQMVESSGSGGADVHARPFANSLQTLQYLDVFP
jgi:hypothetical protein